MEQEARQKAMQLSKAAYQAGVDGLPIESLGVKHPLLEMQYLRGAVVAGHGEAALSAAHTISALESAVKVMTVALDNMVDACLSSDGSIKQPDRRDVMKARSMLPAYCKHTLTKQH